MPGALVAFLTGQGPDGRGRAVTDVIGLTDADLERHHDFIQWLFPLTEPSGAVPGSPVLAPADVVAIRASATARQLLLAAALRMSRFYADTDGWLAASDHNHLRITRIIRSLRLLVGDEAADGFREAILARAEGSAVSDRSRTYWAAA